ncbi:hypothetical protein V8C86DRAFT_1837086 [Haematococcus lacustris]
MSMYIAVTLVFMLSMALGRELDEQLIGWRGESYKPQAPQRLPWVETIAWRPRAFYFHNFLTDEEAQHIVNISWPQMQRSTVVGANGSSVLDDYRTSYGTFVNRYQDSIMQAIQDRIALYTHAPVLHQEDMQVLRYGVGQYYHRHQDSLSEDSPRMATLLLYLSDATEGGETAFPERSQWAHPQLEQTYGAEFSSCAKGHVAVKPRRGDGLLFWSTHPDGSTMDPASTHEGCPVLVGSKWTTTTWIHTKPFRPEEYNPSSNKYRVNPPFQDPGFCTDGSDQCPKWAAAGECERNSVFMKGGPLVVGNCMKSCRVCTECSTPGDTTCYMRNRQAVGYLAFNQSELEYRRPDLVAATGPTRQRKIINRRSQVITVV